MNKAFTNHKANGVYLKLPNGNGISTIWGSGSYTDNHDWVSPDGDMYKDYVLRIKEGSNDVEVMVDCPPLMLELLLAKFTGHSAGSSVFGHLSITEWIEMLNILAKDYAKV